MSKNIIRVSDAKFYLKLDRPGSFFTIHSMWDKAVDIAKLNGDKINCLSRFFTIGVSSKILGTSDITSTSMPAFDDTKNTAGEKVKAEKNEDQKEEQELHEYQPWYTDPETGSWYKLEIDPDHLRVISKKLLKIPYEGKRFTLTLPAMITQIQPKGFADRIESMSRILLILKGEFIPTKIGEMDPDTVHELITREWRMD